MVSWDHQHASQDELVNRSGERRLTSLLARHAAAQSARHLDWQCTQQDPSPAPSLVEHLLAVPKGGPDEWLEASRVRLRDVEL